MTDQSAVAREIADLLGPLPPEPRAAEMLLGLQALIARARQEGAEEMRDRLLDLDGPVVRVCLNAFMRGHLGKQEGIDWKNDTLPAVLRQLEQLLRM
jgi:hypothetical protein